MMHHGGGMHHHHHTTYVEPAMDIVVQQGDREVAALPMERPWEVPFVSMEEAA